MVIEIERYALEIQEGPCPMTLWLDRALVDQLLAGATLEIRARAKENNETVLKPPREENMTEQIPLTDHPGYARAHTRYVELQAGYAAGLRQGSRLGSSVFP
jgi:hypothetical protein